MAHFSSLVGKDICGGTFIDKCAKRVGFSWYANGGWLVKLSFFLLTPLWWYFTWKGFQTARKKQLGAHKKWMMRSYALTLSAISLRVYQLVLGHWFYLDPITQYVLVSWLSWIGNLVMAEILIRNEVGRFFRKVATSVSTNMTIRKA